MVPEPVQPAARGGASLRVRLNLGIILIVGITFAGLNTYTVRANRQARRAEALATNETMARLIAGALLGELVDSDLRSPRIVTFLHNFLASALTLNARNKELAFALVVTADNVVVAGQARPELTVFAGGVTYSSAPRVLAEIARAEGHLGPNMSVKRFPLKVGARGLVGKLLVGTSLARVEADALRDLWLNLGIFVGTLALLVAYSGMALSRLVVQPVTQVARAMLQVQRGELGHEVNLKRRDEIGVLADSYNFMVRGLRERERLKDAFDRYVSPQVYEQMSSGQIDLTGEARRATVLFSDIRSFTSLSEKLSPAEVVAMLNEYFDVMVEVVLKHEGFLNKFIGDALMAVYNVPATQSDPELRAVTTAVEMVQRLAELNVARTARGQPVIRIGIGINTGPVVAGNIGHERRLEYTVIGDAVNLAQRIESQTKVAGATILVSGSTHDAVAQAVHALPLAPVRVKGKAEPVVLYAITGLRAQATGGPATPPVVASTSGDDIHMEATHGRSQTR